MIRPPTILRPRRAAILLVVLGFIFLASVLVVALLSTVGRQIRSAAAAAARDDLRLEAYSAMQVAIAALSEIKEIDGGLYSPTQGWGNLVDYAEVDWPENLVVTITVTDETGRLSLQSIDEDQLRALLEQLDVDFNTANELIDAYLDWTDEDDLERLNGAEVDYYERLDPPVTPPNAAISSYESFRYIKGFDEVFFDENGAPNDLFRRFRESTTLDYEGDVNLNTASADIRAMLADEGKLDERALEDLQQGLDQSYGSTDDGYLQSDDDLGAVGLSDDEGYGYEAHALRIVVRVEQGAKQFQLESLISDDDSDSSSSDGSSSDDDDQNGSGDDTDGQTASSGSATSSGTTTSERRRLRSAAGSGTSSGTSSSGEVEVSVGEAGDSTSGSSGSSSSSRSGSGSSEETPTLGDWKILDWSENG